MCKVCTPHLRPWLVSFAGFGPCLCFFWAGTPGGSCCSALVESFHQVLWEGDGWISSEKADFKWRRADVEFSPLRSRPETLISSDFNKSDGLLPTSSLQCLDRKRRKVDRRKASQEMLLTRTLLGAPGLTTRSKVRY